MSRLSLLFFVFLWQIPAAAAEDDAREGDYLYRVTTLRAAPGKFEDLLNWYTEVAASGYYDDALEPAPVLMRHSQGDQWDLLVLYPMQSVAAWYSESAIEQRAKAGREHVALIDRFAALVAFEEDVFAYGPPLVGLQRAYLASNLFHIEMFHALPGKAQELLEQRRMENDYLAATGQTTNMIFRRAAGSDVDGFTIGFHESLEAYAAPAPVTDAEKEIAAREAGFKDRADLSFYLRSLLQSHHDTLAVPVRD